jgi:hypothetical protein
MIDDDLLELADHLVSREVRRPKQISLRHAISTAYYAVFHALATMCAKELVGWSKSWEAVTPIYRSLDHTVARRVFNRALDGAYGEEIVAIGRTFILLQQERYTADYDPQPFSRSREEIRELIDQARRAAQVIRAISREQRLLLAVHLIARQR